MRLLILMGLAYIGYRAVKSWLARGPLSSSNAGDEISGRIDDVMVKDPSCETYIPKRNSIQLELKGKTLYFCSAECRDSYVEQNGT